MNIPQVYELSWSTEILKSTHEYKKNLYSAIADCGFTISNYTKNQSSLGLGLIDSVEAAFYTGKALVSKVANAFFITYFGNGDSSQSTQLLTEASKFGYLFVNSLANICSLGVLNKFVMSTETHETDSPDTASEPDTLSEIGNDDISIASTLEDDQTFHYNVVWNTPTAEVATDTSDLPIQSYSISACKASALALTCLIAGFVLTIPTLLVLYPPQRLTY